MLQVTAVQVSNNWNVSLAEGSLRLELLAKKHESEDLYKEYLVRGVASKLRTIITVVPEAKVQAYQDKLESFSKTLFAVAKKFPCNKTLLYKLEPPKFMRLRLDQEPIVPVPVHVIPPPRPVWEKEKKKNIFAMPAGSSSKKQTKVEKKPEAKVEKKPEAKVSPEATPKKEQTGGSSAKTATTVKKSPAQGGSHAKGKQAPKVQMGKGSISSFFGQKSAASSTQVKKESPPSQVVKKVEPAREEKKSPKESPMAKKEPSDDATRKRNLSSDRGSESDNKKNKSMEEPSSKKAKKDVKTKKMEKRSRIMAICDSDSSDGETPVAKGRVFESEEEVEPEPEHRFSPKEPPMEEKQKASPDENRNPAAKKRRKATRKVTRSYEDEEGFIRTVRETEEYSCSEEEEVVEVKKEVKEKSSGSAKPSSSTTSALKPKAPTKQGSIMSFFGKK